jgi:chitodextrinase
MPLIPYDSAEEADTRSAEMWAMVRGPGWQPGNVTTRLYPAVDDETVGPALLVPERTARLDTLIAGDQMQAREVVPCAPLYPAWTAGVAYQAGDICTYDGSMYCVRQAHTSQADWPPDLVLALFQVWRDNADTLLDWIASERVEVGWRRTYGGAEYECIQAHVTQSDRLPPNVPALWAAVAPPTAEWATGVAYKVGDVVIYLGNEYRCLQAHTSIQTWNPVATLNVLWALM